MILCPYCKTELTGEATLPRMRSRMLRIYHAVLEAGPDGISPQDLLVRMYAEEEWPTPGGGTVLRVNIHELNKIIGPQQQRIINWHRGKYRLIHTEVQHDQEIINK